MQWLKKELCLGPDIFQRLVPIEAHEASSLYSEEQAKLLRTVCSDIEIANGDLAVFLSALQLDDIPREEDLIQVPQELIECAASLSVRYLEIPQKKIKYQTNKYFICIVQIQITSRFSS